MGLPQQPREKPRRRWFRTAAYAVLAVTCLLSAGILLSSARYGFFAPLVQVLLTAVWAALAVASWREGVG